MDIEQIKLITTFISIVLALFAIFKWLLEYNKKNQLERAKVYLELRQRFKETDNFATIISYLDSNNDKLKDINKSDKLKFLGFLEEIALMVNSGLLNKKIANQSFGFYIRKAWANPHMWWEGNSKDSEYRILLKWIKDECETIHNSPQAKEASYYRF